MTFYALRVGDDLPECLTFFSTRRSAESVRQKQMDKILRQDQERYESEMKLYNEQEKTVQEYYRHIRELVLMLKRERFNIYESWRDIGMMINRVTDGKGMDIWKEVSKIKDPEGYQKEGTQKKMNDIWGSGSGGLGYNSLTYLVVQDNPGFSETSSCIKPSSVILPSPPMDEEDLKRRLSFEIYELELKD